MKNKLYLVFALGLLTLFSCNKDNYYSGKFNFDISGISQPGTKSGIPGIKSFASVPFCNLSKFEVEILYINVTMYSLSNPDQYSSHTLLNREQNQGVKFNMVNQKLSDKVSLSFENPIGNCVAAIDIGLGDNITVNGYIDSSGVIVRSSPAGFVSDGGISQDYIMTLDPNHWETLHNDPGKEPLAKENLLGLMLNVDNRSDINSVIKIDSTSTLDMKWLLSNAVYLWENKWIISSKYWAAPFVEGQFDYEVYYLKRQDENKYTDIMGALFNKQGYVPAGFLSIGQTVGFDINHNLLRSAASLPQGPTVSINEFFRKNNDGTVFFKVSAGTGTYSTFPSFIRGNHSGTMTRDDGAVINYDCLKVN